MNLDNQIFSWFQSFVGKIIFVDWLAIFCAKYLIWIIVALCFAWWLELAKTRSSESWPYFGKRKWLEIGELILSITWAVIINQILSILHFKPRPFVVKNVNSLIDVPYSIKSFPSDHSTVVFALALTIFFYDRKMGSLLLFLSLLVGLSRVYVGVHYPIDVFIGALVGVVAALLIRVIFLNTILKKK